MKELKVAKHENNIEGEIAKDIKSMYLFGLVVDVIL